jgi:hypothetical protein
VKLCEVYNAGNFRCLNKEEREAGKQSTDWPSNVGVAQ